MQIKYKNDHTTKSKFQILMFVFWILLYDYFFSSFAFLEVFQYLNLVKHLFELYFICIQW